jgi:hypothetical protein
MRLSILAAAMAVSGASSALCSESTSICSAGINGLDGPSHDFVTMGSGARLDITRDRFNAMTSIDGGSGAGGGNNTGTRARADTVISDPADGADDDTTDDGPSRR